MYIYIYMLPSELVCRRPGQGERRERERERAHERAKERMGECVRESRSLSNLNVEPSQDAGAGESRVNEACV